MDGAAASAPAPPLSDDDEDVAVNTLALQPAPSPQPQQPQPQPAPARALQDGAAVTVVKCGDPPMDMTGSVYEGRTRLCELPRHGKKARELACGEGKLTLTDGSKYEGGFLNGQRHGHGKWSSHGEVYEGEWREDSASGPGRLTLPDGSYCEGQWTEGNPLHATKVEVDGSKYVGEFYKDKRHGKGTEYSADGTIVHEGEWIKGKPYEPKPKAKKRDYKFADRVSAPAGAVLTICSARPLAPTISHACHVDLTFRCMCCETCVRAAVRTKCRSRRRARWRRHTTSSS